MLRSMAHAPCRKQPPSSCSCALQLLRRATHSHMHTWRMQEAPLSLEMAEAAARAMLLPRRDDALPYAYPEDAGGVAPKTREVVVEGIQHRQQRDVHAYSLRSHTEQRDSEGDARSGRVRTVGL